LGVGSGEGKCSTGIWAIGMPFEAEKMCEFFIAISSKKRIILTMHETETSLVTVQ
jgi:hypothetical protein